MRFRVACAALAAVGAGLFGCADAEFPRFDGGVLNPDIRFLRAGELMEGVKCAAVAFMDEREQDLLKERELSRLDQHGRIRRIEAGLRPNTDKDQFNYDPFTLARKQGVPDCKRDQHYGCALNPDGSQPDSCAITSKRCVANKCDLPVQAAALARGRPLGVTLWDYSAKSKLDPKEKGCAVIPDYSRFALDETASAGISLKLDANNSGFVAFSWIDVNKVPFLHGFIAAGSKTGNGVPLPNMSITPKATTSFEMSAVMPQSIHLFNQSSAAANFAGGAPGFRSSLDKNNEGLEALPRQLQATAEAQVRSVVRAPGRATDVQPTPEARSAPAAAPPVVDKLRTALFQLQGNSDALEDVISLLQPTEYWPSYVAIAESKSIKDRYDAYLKRIGYLPQEDATGKAGGKPPQIRITTPGEKAAPKANKGQTGAGVSPSKATYDQLDRLLGETKNDSGQKICTAGGEQACFKAVIGALKNARRDNEDDIAVLRDSGSSAATKDKAIADAAEKGKWVATLRGQLQNLNGTAYPGKLVEADAVLRQIPDMIEHDRQLRLKIGVHLDNLDRIVKSAIGASVPKPGAAAKAAATGAAKKGGDGSNTASIKYAFDDIQRDRQRGELIQLVLGLYDNTAAVELNAQIHKDYDSNTKALDDALKNGTANPAPTPKQPPPEQDQKFSDQCDRHNWRYNVDERTSIDFLGLKNMLNNVVKEQDARIYTGVPDVTLNTLILTSQFQLTLEVQGATYHLFRWWPLVVPPTMDAKKDHTHTLKVTFNGKKQKGDKGGGAKLVASCKDRVKTARADSGLAALTAEDDDFCSTPNGQLLEGILQSVEKSSGGGGGGGGSSAQ